MFDIIVKQPQGEEIDWFLDLVIEKMQKYIYDNIDDRHVERFDQYLSAHPEFIQYAYGFGRKTPPSTKDILIGASNNLVARKSGNNQYQILINPSANIPNTVTKYESIIAFIDKGNMDISPYELWSNMIDHFCEEMPTLYREYGERIL